MKQQGIFLIVFLLLCACNTYGQYNTPQNKVWVFGVNTGLNFNTGSPVPISSGMPGTEGSAFVCDGLGNLLFYSTGDSVYNITGAPMPHGGSLTSPPYGAGSTTQGVLIVPVIGSTTQYYVFSLEFKDAVNGQLSYSIVDMTLDVGLGDVIPSTLITSVDTMFSEKMIAIPGNACNIWVVVHKRNLNAFYAYNITSAGIDTTPVISYSGILSGANAYTIGAIKCSHNRRMIANACTPPGEYALELHDFDPNTGIVSNCRALETTIGYYGIEFSQDDGKLYANETSAPGGIVQFDVSLSSTAAIIASKYYVVPPVTGIGNWRQLKLGPDNKIYFRNGTTTTSSYLDCISSPNLAGAACNYIPKAVNLSPSVMYTSLPNVFYIPVPGADTIYGNSSLCAGTTIVLSDSAAGGIWSTSNSGVATVGSGTGIVTGVSAGTAFITYSVTNICGSAYAIKAVTVNPSPTTITGNTNICVGNTTTLSDTISGGTWSSNNPAVATIGSVSGFVSGASIGTTVISYVLPGGCYKTATITVIAFPNAGVITGPSLVCTGDTIKLTDTTGTGVWSSSNSAKATVGPATGMVTGISAGTVIISYTVTYTCGSAAVTKTISVNTSPAAITGPSIICGTDTILLANSTSGGVWSSNNTTVATVGSLTGVVSGHSSGIAVISYSLGNCFVTKTITVNPVPHAGVIQNDGVGAFCVGSNMHAWDTTAGGVWSVSNGDAVLSGSTLTAVSPGLDTVFYIVSNSCGRDTAVFPFIVTAPPPIPYGDKEICVGDTTILKDSITGGMWNGTGHVSVYPLFVDSCMVVGRSAGAATLTYSIDLGCIVNFEVTVNPDPNVGPITGPDSVCKNAAIALEDSVAGGVWGAQPPGIITIDSSSGLVNITTTGSVIITYKVPPNIYGCSNEAKFNLSVLSKPDFGISSTVLSPKCYGDTGSIVSSIAGGSGSYHYLWSNGDSTASINNISHGTYLLIVKDIETQCLDSGSFTVTQPDSLAVLFSIKKDLCKTGTGSIAAIASGGTSPYQYSWSNNAHASEIDNLFSGIYQLSITDANGCHRADSVVLEDTTCEDIIIYNAVSPNGDGKNDTWIIEGIQSYPGCHVQVFDKWGDMIFEETGYKNDWRGKGKNGTEVPDGTYYYVVKLNAKNKVGGADTFKGTLLIKR